MRYFRITTPTVLDVREIVTIGLTSKAAGDKIGHKGSGLKFALSFLHRLGGYIEAKGSDYHLKSQAKEITLRGNTHLLLELQSVSDPTQAWETHMTQHAGADTWTEPWFILRELIQNALDENGTYEVVEDPTIPSDAVTVVQVPMVAELEDAWANKEEWFQPRFEGLVGIGHDKVKGLYFHGFLVYRAQDTWAYSYDVTGILQRSELSEDRQVRNINLSAIFLRLAEKMSFDFNDGSIYHTMLGNSLPEDISNIDDGVYSFIRSERKAWGGATGFNMDKLLLAVKSVFGENIALATNEISSDDPHVYYARAAGFNPVRVSYGLCRLLSGYAGIPRVDACLPNIAKRLKKVTNVEVSKFEKLKAAMRLVRKVKPENVKIEVVTKILESDKMECLALADIANNRILVLETLLDRDVPEIAKALIEEYVHITSGGGDMSQQMQRGLIDVIYDLLATKRRINVSNICQ